MYRKCFLLLLVSVVITTMLCVIVDARPSEPGKEWVRSHPFTTSALIYSDIPWNTNTYKACNFNSSHPWFTGKYLHGNPILVQSSQANGLMWHCCLNAKSLTTPVMNQVNNLSTLTQDNGWYVRDEPPSSEFPGIAEVSSWLKSNRPNALIYLSTANFSDSYLDPLIAQIAPDALSYCNYPFYADSTHLHSWYDAVTRMRNKTLYHGIPMFAWIQAFAGSTWRVPTQGEVRLLVFTSLTAGAKGVFYFLYDRDELPDTTHAITDLGGVPNSLYYQVQVINDRVNNVGKALRYLNSTDIRYVRGGSNPVPAGLTNWSYGAGGNTLITNVQVDPGQTGAEKDGFIGFFNDDTGKKYFMLTNAYRSGALNFSITFDSSVNQITRLNRFSGQQEVLNLNNHVLNLNLPSGMGDLFCMTTNGFDLGPPTGSVAINGGAAATGSRSVTLTIAASDDKGVTHMRFSNDLWQWSSWESYDTSKQWTLTAGNGNKTVYAQFRDAVGTSSTRSDTILLDIIDPYPRVQWLWQATIRSGAPGSRVSPFDDGVNTLTENNMSGSWAWYWDTPAMGQVTLRNTTSSYGRGFMDSNDFGEAFNVDTGITVAARIKPVVVAGFGSLCLSVNNSSTQDLSSPEEPAAKSTHMWVGWEDSGGKDKVVFVSRSGTELKSFLYDNGNSLYRNTWCTWTLGAKQIGNTMAWDLWINGVHQSPNRQASDGTYHTLVWSKSTDMGTSVRIGQRQMQSDNHDTAWDYMGIAATGVIPGWNGLSDVSPPSVPSDVEAVAQSETSVQITWTASVDNVGVTGYKIFRNGLQIGTSATTSFQNTGLSAGTTYSYSVSAYDAAGNNSAKSSPPAAVTTLDNTAPSVPNNVSGTAQSETSVEVIWTASTDNVGVTGYKIFRNGNLAGTSGTTSFIDMGLSAGTTYSYRVSAYDAAGNNSAQSAQATVTTPDNTAPSVPTDVAATAQTPRSVKITWSAASDNVAVTGYSVYRNGIQLATSNVTSYTDTGLTPGTTYSYRISAYDASNNSSAQSSPPAVAITMVAVDITAAKQLADSTIVGLVSQIVTAVFDDYFYVGGSDHYAGIRIVPLEMPLGVTVGSSVDIGGIMQTLEGERQIGEAVVSLGGD